MKFFLALLFLAILAAPQPAQARFDPPQTPTDAPDLNAASPSGHLLLSAASNGAWNIYSADPNGNSLTKFSTNITPARDPAPSPDGKTLAFRSKRDGLWEIYTMPVSSGAPTKISRGIAYSGSPVWSPDGKKIAFEAYTGGDLDIWLMDANGSNSINLTDDAKAQDYAPAFSPDGNWVAFTSWRTGTQQIFITDATCGVSNCRKAFNLSMNKFNDAEPAWSPDGKRVAFVSDRDGQRAIYTADFAITGLRNVQRLTFSGWDDQPAWSPDGNFIAFISARPTRTPVYIIPSSGGLPRVLDNSPEFAASVAWARDALIAPEELGDTNAPSYKSTPGNLQIIRTTRVDGGFSRLSSRVADSFAALQSRVKQQVGLDFMGTLADMARPLEFKCDVTCDTLSWHKAGRAIDTRLDSSGGLEIVREDMLGETFWRVYLRAATQDGTLGEPLKEAPWDLSYRARWVVGKGDGGLRKPVPVGFYVDFTELARTQGWQRISSHDEEEFDWKTNKLATEYWHIQKTDGMKWYAAMNEVYMEAELKSLTNWDALIKADYDPYLLIIKGIPTPSKAWKWYALAP